MNDRPNVVVVVSDTLRAADVGCYGPTETRTPNIDAFARRAVRFTNAYPESLPTIPVRRALHTGRRCFPFPEWHPVKWDIVYLPGWEPMANDEDTLAENLAAAGYQTGFVTDTMPYFAPGLNFTRGFWQWEFVRGQQQDRWQSPFSVPRERLARYGDPDEIMATDPRGIVRYHLANTAHVRSEEDTSTAQVFRWASRFLEDNRSGPPFYLLVDCFDPHEPWEAPEPYFRMYWGDRPYGGRRIVCCQYAPADSVGYTAEEIAFIRAHYRGLVTLVDAWFGRFLARLDELGLAENTAVFLISDHGTNFCDNPLNVIGKPDYALYPGVVRLPFLARLPDGAGAATTRDELVYNLDLTATAYDLAGIESAQGIDGRSLLSLVRGTGDWRPREHVTCRYASAVCYIDQDTWAIGDVASNPLGIFDRRSDPCCMRPLDDGPRWDAAWGRLLGDAGGPFRDYRRSRTDAIGRKPLTR